MKARLITLLILAAACSHARRDLVNDPFPEDQASIRQRLDEIWAAGKQRDFARLGSFHMYGPKFTGFKESAPRTGAAENENGERADFTMLSEPTVDMKELKIDVFGEVAVVTFNGAFGAKIQGNPVALEQGVTMVFVKVDGDWRITHEHFSPLGASPPHG